MCRGSVQVGKVREETEAPHRDFVLIDSHLGMPSARPLSGNLRKQREMVGITVAEIRGEKLDRILPGLFRAVENCAGMWTCHPD